MVTEIINIRLEKKFLSEIDIIVKEENYQSRTELIRQSLREKIEERNMKKALLNLKGSLKTKTNGREYTQLKERLANKILRSA